jgi:hypothetical protein
MGRLLLSGETLLQKTLHFATRKELFSAPPQCRDLLSQDITRTETVMAKGPISYAVMPLDTN